MKVSMSSGPDYESKYDWDCYCQGGKSGLVLPKGSFDKIFSDDILDGLSEGFSSSESYTTAFFESFPRTPDCFLRGEGKTIEEAEESCWKKYQKVCNCKHEMERRNRTDGYGYCKHCSYSSMVFEPLTKCCKCGKPAAYSQDHRKRWYCKKHDATKPKSPNPSIWEISSEKRVPRKQKKLLIKCAKKMFEFNAHFGDVKFKYYAGKTFTCGGYQYTIFNRREEKKFINKWKAK